MKKSKSILFRRYLPLIKNKYTLTLLGFIVWLSFFDKNDFITTNNYRKNLESLKQEKAYYEEGIRKNTEDLNNLLTNSDNLIKYARENYLMKKDNEDLFVILDETQKKK